MAEYYMTYNEISQVLDEYLDEAVFTSNARKYKAEILAAITGNYEQNDLKSVHQMIELWQNQIAQPSQLLLRDRYICVQSAMLNFLRDICTSGLLEALIQYVTTKEVSGFSVSVCVSVSIAVWDLFNKVKKLDNWDFCIYMQAVTHYHEHVKFTKEDLKEWFPDGSGKICNMHNDQWECDYWGTDDTCSIMSEAHIEEAIDSLCEKELLRKDKEKGEYVYSFKH